MHWSVKYFSFKHVTVYSNISLILISVIIQISLIQIPPIVPFKFSPIPLHWWLKSLLFKLHWLFQYLTLTTISPTQIQLSIPVIGNFSPSNSTQNQERGPGFSAILGENTNVNITPIVNAQRVTERHQLSEWGSPIVCVNRTAIVEAQRVSERHQLSWANEGYP